MSLVLLRIDERLIHGQVVLGWGSAIRVQRYVVVDDRLAASEWEQNLYELALEKGQRAVFATVDEARARMADWGEDAVPTVLLTADVDTMMRLARGGVLRGASVNVGGIHHAIGRREVLPYVHLNDWERELLRALHDEEGVEISAQDLPTSHRVTLDKLLA